ncbi:MAG: HU family DNA-binding protein [Clostridium sp.]|nr:HU family DNA-binding protein [Clostridium sp.]
MDRDGLILKIAERSGYSEEETRRFYGVLVEMFNEILGRGESIECLPEWGSFAPKLRDNPGRQENSPRKEKKPHYYIRFRPSKQFERDLFNHIGPEHAEGRDRALCLPPVWEEMRDES